MGLIADQEKMVSKQEDRAIKAIQNETQREGGKKHISQLQDDCGQSNIGLAKSLFRFFCKKVQEHPNELFGLPNTCTAIVPKGGGGTDKTCEHTMAENSPNLMKTIIPWSQEVKKKNPKHKKQRKQSDCLNSVKKKS